MIVLGYLGFIASMPDKTSGSLIPVLLLCVLMVVSGVVVLVGALVCAFGRAESDRRRSNRGGV